MSYTPQYTKPYANGYVDRPSKETPERASFINARDDTLIRIEKYLSTLNFDGKYALLTEAGYSFELSIDEYYVLTISLKNKAGTVISSKQIDFPIESMIINVDYNKDTGIITFNLQNGQSLEVNISTLVRGLVADTRTIAGIDLKDDITAEELKEALGMYDEGLTAGTLKPWLYDTENEVEIGVYNGKPLYRQVYVYEEVSIVGGMAYVTIDVENPEEIYIENAYAVAPDGGIWPIPYAHSNAVNNIGVFISSDYKGLNFRLGTAHEGTVIKACVILNYTKTTDLEGSGNNLNPYGIYDAKLDDVKSSIDSVSEEVDAVEEQLKKPTHLFDGNFKFYTSDRSSESANMASIQSDLSTAATYFAGRYCFVHIVFANGVTYDYIGSVVNSNYAVFEEMSYSSTEKRRFILKAGEWTIETLIDSKDLIDTDGTIISYTADNKAEALAYLNNPTTIPFIGARTRCYNFLFADSVGDSPFGGGYVRISGYTYSNNLYGMQMAYRFGQRPKWRSNNNGVWSEWDGVGTLAEVTALQKATESDIDAINNRLAYKDISSSIDVGDTGCTVRAYVENGCVALYITVPADSTRATALTIDTAYAPRFAIGGSLASISAASDMGKIMGVALSNGTISMFVSGTLDADETFSFTYPLKSS